VPGFRLLHPLPLGAALLVGLNDLLLKPRFPESFIKGKLSDLGICFLLPVMLVSAWEWLRFLGERARGERARGGRAPFQPSGRALSLAACLTAAAYFALLKLWPPFTSLHLSCLARVAPFINHVVTPDLTDLVALVMVPLAFLYRERARGPVAGDAG